MQQESANYLSIGCRDTETHGAIINGVCLFGGCYNFPQNKLFEFIAKYHDCPEFLWSFVERRTEYFMLFCDFDIDKYLPAALNINVSELCEHLVDMIVSILSDYIILSDNSDEIKYIFSDRSDNKSNFHLYFPNIILNKSQALTIRCKLIDKLLETNKYNMSKDIYNNIIDESIYKSSGLKHLFIRKPHDKGYYKILLEKSTYKRIPKAKLGQLYVTSIRKTNTAININMKLNDDGCPILMDDVELFNISEKTQKNIKTKKKQVTDVICDNDSICIFKLDIPENMVIELFNNLNVMRYSAYDSWIKIMFVCLNYGLSQLAHIVSQKCPAKYDKNEVNKLFNKYKKSSLVSKPITVGSLYKWSKDDNQQNHDKILDKYYTEGYFKEVEYDVINDLDYVKNVEVYNENFVRELDISKYKSFIMKSSLGTNKTGECIKAIVNISEKEKVDRINCVASRVVLCSDLFNRFNENLHNETVNRPIKLNMVNYFEKKKETLYLEKKLVQTPDSLIYMNYNDESGDNVMESPDILFIDEIESLLEYVCMSSTLSTKRRVLFDILCDYIRNAKYMFLVDGNLSKPIFDYLCELRGDKELKFIYNKKKTDDNKYYFIKNECEWHAQLDEYLKNGKNVYIPSDSKEYTEIIEKYIKDTYPNYKIQVYNVNTDQEHKIKLGNVNETWKQYQAVICSPTILYGVNFSELHFDAIFGYYQQTILPGSVYQQLRRIRFVKEKQVFIYLKDSMGFAAKYNPVSATEIKSYIVNNLKEFKHILNDLEITSNRGLTVNDKDPFTKFYLHFLQLRNEANNDYLKELIVRINEWGGQCFVQVKKPRKDKEFEDTKKKILDDIKTEYIQELLKADADFTQQSYEESKKKLYKTQDDKNNIIVNYIRSSFNLRSLNEQFIKDLGKISNVDKFLKSQLYFADDDQKIRFINKHYDKEIDLGISLIFKQIEIIKECVKLFWVDGLLNVDQIRIYAGKNNLSDEQKVFLKKYENDMRLSFSSLNRKGKLTATYMLLRCLNDMLGEFFGGFIFLDISNEKYSKSKNKQIIYYIVTINQLRYIELSFNKRYNFTQSTPKTFMKLKCHYIALHSTNTIEEFNVNDDDYAFINDNLFIQLNPLDYL